MNQKDQHIKPIDEAKVSVEIDHQMCSDGDNIHTGDEVIIRSKGETIHARFRGDEDESVNGEDNERFKGDEDDSGNGEVGRAKDLLEPFICMEFDSPDDAKNFYNAYAKRHGFSIRCSSTKYDKIDRTLISRDFVCSKEGFRPSKNVRLAHQVKETRTGCKAILRVQRKRDTTKGWIVTKFSNEHNHELVNPSKSFMLRSHRNMSSCQKSMVGLLDDEQVAPKQMVHVMEAQAGGQYELVGFNNQDLRNYLKRKRRNSCTDEMLRYNNLMCMFIKLAEKGSKTLDNYNIAIKIAEDGLAKLCDDVPTKVGMSPNDYPHVEDIIREGDDVEMSNKPYLLDPEIANTKGLHPSVRLKPFFEKIHSKSKKSKSSEKGEVLDKEHLRRRACSNFHEKGHDMPTCKVIKSEIQ